MYAIYLGLFKLYLSMPNGQAGEPLRPQTSIVFSAKTFSGKFQRCMHRKNIYRSPGVRVLSFRHSLAPGCVSQCRKGF